MSIMQKSFDRTAEDLGNSVHLDHVNTTVPDQRLASLFYGTGLGLTRDPYLQIDDTNMWMNVGRSQFHLPTGGAQVLRGKTGIVIEGREELLARLAAIKSKLADTKFRYIETSDYVEATCPWGNTIRLHQPDAARFGRVNLAIAYVEFDVPVGTAADISLFYQRMLDVPATVLGGEAAIAKVAVGKQQYLLFRETDRPIPKYDEHHLCIYVANFSGPHKRLSESGLAIREDNQYQYRFRDLVNLANGTSLFVIEHEVRCMTHPNFMRPLVNRNPNQTVNNYANGYDAIPWAMDPANFDDVQARLRAKKIEAATTG